MAQVLRKRPCKCSNPKTCPHRQWTARYFYEGKQRERSFKTKTDADDFVAKFEHDKRESIFVDPRNGRITFTEYAERWIEDSSKSVGTKATYRSVLNAQIRPVLGTRSLAQVAADREGVWSLVSGMTGSSSRKSACLTVIKGACDEAVRAGKIPSHRLDGLSIKTDAIEPAVIIPATSEQLETLAGELDPRFALTVWLMRGCGLRISEALAVRLTGFRDGGKVLRVCEQVNRDGGLGPLKSRKRGEYRDVPVPSWLWAKVQAHVTEYGTDDGYLFSRNGKRVTYGMQHERFTRSARKAGLAGLSEHGLRHLYVSTLLHGGVQIHEVAHWVGHRDINVTHAVYGHLLPDAWTRGREALELAY